jgi:hypothetical protein
MTRFRRLRIVRANTVPRYRAPWSRADAADGYQKFDYETIVPQTCRFSLSHLVGSVGAIIVFVLMNSVR